MAELGEIAAALGLAYALIRGWNLVKQLLGS